MIDEKTISPRFRSVRLFTRESKKCFAKIHRALYGDAKQKELFSYQNLEQ